MSSYKAVFRAFPGKWCLYNFFRDLFSIFGTCLARLASAQESLCLSALHHSIKKGSYLNINQSLCPAHGLHRLVVICSPHHSKCTWLFRTIRINLHLRHLVDLRLGRPCLTSTLLRMPRGSSSPSRWGLVRRLLTFLLYPCRCRHRRHGKACSPTPPPQNVRHCSTNAQLCLACWM